MKEIKAKFTHEGILAHLLDNIVLHFFTTIEMD